MKFGSEMMFQTIAANLHDSENYQWYEEMFRCISSDATMLLRKDHIAEEDIEDIVQEVQISVAKNLVPYVEQSVDKTEQQRNSWLKTIVKNKEMDFFRKSARTSTESMDAMETDIPDTFNTTEKAMVRLELFEAIEKLSQINSAPDRLLAFLLNKISAISNEAKGGPKKIENEFYHKTLKEVYDEVKYQLFILLQGEISDDILKPLRDKVEPVANDYFSLDARTITDSSSWITKKMKERKDT